MLLRESGVLILSRPTRPLLAPVLGCHNQLQLGDPGPPGRHPEVAVPVPGLWVSGVGSPLPSRQELVCLALPCLTTILDVCGEVQTGHVVDLVADTGFIDLFLVAF